MATKPANTVLKAFKLLELFQHRATLSVSQCAMLLKVPRATAHRLLITLEAAGIVERSSRGHYQLGLRMFELGSLAPLRRIYSEQSRIPLQKLSAQTGLPVHLAVREEYTGTLLEVIPGSRYDMPTRVGFPVPMHATAVGKQLLAHATPDVVERVIAPGLPRFTEHTICNGQQLRDELERVRQTGIAYDLEECHSGFSCVGIPLRVGTDRVSAAVSIVYSADEGAETSRSYLQSLTLVRNKVEEMVGRHLQSTLPMLRGIPAPRNATDEPPTAAVSTA